MRATPKPSRRPPSASSPDLGAPTQSWFEGQGAAPTVAASTGEQGQASASRTPRPGRVPEARPHTFFRIYRAFLAARAALAALLCALQAMGWALGTRPEPTVFALTVTYTLLALGWYLLPGQSRPRHADHRRLSHPQALATIGIDLAFFVCLHFILGNSFNTQALLALPVLMSAILLPRLLALGVAAAGSLNLLAVAWTLSSTGGQITASLTQAGLAGLGLFAIALVASELAGRLALEERSARGSREQARLQAQLNELVLDEMREGVLVADRRGRVHTANPSARRLLASQGHTPPPPFQLRGVPAWEPLVQAIEQAFATPDRADQGMEVRLRFDDQTRRILRMRMRFTEGRDGHGVEDLCVIFMDDLRAILARQRQDKLAAMGRMSAGIAHEIRNPLAAITQANALLSEDAATATQRRLTQMVQDNAERLKHIVNDVLDIAPGSRQQAPWINVMSTTRAICQEWRSTLGSDPSLQSALRLDLPEVDAAIAPTSLNVRFEPDHLQRVLVNLLDNALRHSTQTPGAVLAQLRWQSAVGGDLPAWRLSIFSDGPPLDPDTEQSLFEPFFSTRSRGTGLGLYISRELCERHGASMDYRQHPPTERHRNEFFVMMPA